MVSRWTQCSSCPNPDRRRVFESLDWPDGDFRIAQAFWSRDEADALLARLSGELAWTQHDVVIFGRRIPSPRLSAWYGDPEASYAYSGRRYVPLPWTPTLLSVRARIEAGLGLRFNGMLANLYRNGRDGMGWHRDNEPELGPMPAIASASFGAVRRFALRHRSGERRELMLGHGSLLLMAGTSQRYWQHALPKTTRSCDARLNLTFRWIHT